MSGLKQWLARWREPLLAVLLILVPLVWHIRFVREYGYLSPPFFYEPYDTFMDWYNTVFWAHNIGAYDSWMTVYPPLAFVILRVLSIKSCYSTTGGMDILDLEVRDCDWLGIVVLGVTFTVNLVLIAFTFRKLDRSTALPRTAALGLGLPMLHALERGNLMLLTFTFFLLGVSPLIKHAWMRWLALGLAINLKIYLIAVLFPHLLRRRWRWFEGALTVSVLVYLLSFIANGDGTPAQLYTNIFEGTYQFNANSFLDGWYAVTYRPFNAILESQFIAISSLIGSDAVETLSLLLPALQRFTQLLIVAAALAVWLRPEAVATHVVTLLGLLMVLVTVETGAYTMTLLTLFVFMERWKGVARPIAIVLAYLLCTSADFFIDRLAPAVRESWIAGGPVQFDFALTVGPFVRPLAVMMVVWCITAAVLADVARDLRTDPGPWRRRFAGELFGAARR